MSSPQPAMRPWCRVRPLAVALAAVALAASPAAAQTWNNPAGGNWNSAANWTGGVPVPGATTTLTFGSAATQTSTYTATNDIGAAGTAFDLNALIFNNTSGLVTINGNPLNFSGAAPTVTVSGAGSLLVGSQVNLATTLTVAGAGTGGFTIGGAVAGGANNIVKTSAGALTLTGGGTLNRLSVQAGGAFITGGTLALTAPTGAGNVDAGLQLGTATGQTVAATVSGGAVVNVTDNTYVADAVGSTGTLTVTGAGTVYNNLGSTAALGRFGVGNGGTGTLNVTAGGVVNANQLFVARLAGGNGSVLVDGPGSLLRGVTQLSFGTAGAGTMTVQNGGSATSDASIFIGRAVGTGISGVVTVTGAGSTMSTGSATGGGAIVVGVLGLGTLNVQNGGAVSTGNAGFAGELVVGSGAATGGTAGTLNVTTGGTVTVTGNFFGATVGPTTADITVDGAGSRLAVSGQFSLAGGGGVVAGAATLNITGGGLVSTGGLTIYGQGPGGSTTVNLNNGQYTAAGQVQMVEGTIVVNVQNAGRLTAAGSVFVAVAPTSTANVTVTGTNSVFATTTATAGSETALVLGGDGATPGGTAVVTASSGGTVSAPGPVVLFGGATLNVNAGGLTSFGTVADGVAGTSAGAVALASGATLTITGAVPGSATGFSGAITGPGGVSKAGPGFQVISGNGNTYAGGTTVSGALAVANTAGSATGPGPVTVASGGLLLGTGIIGGQVTVASGGTLSAGVTDTGVLRLTNAVGLAVGSTLSIAINGTTPGSGAGGHDQINLGTTGSILFNGATLDVSANTNALTTASTITIILGPANSIGAGNIFAGLPNGSQFFIPNAAGTPGVSDFYRTTINYDYAASNVVLTNFVPVPEPAHMLLLTVAVGGLGRRLRRRPSAAPAVAA